MVRSSILISALAIALPATAQTPDFSGRCLAETSPLGQQVSFFYGCMQNEAARLERSGADAQSIADAAESGCRSDWNKVVDVANGCELLSRSIGFKEGFGDGMKTGAAKTGRQLAIHKVVEIRAARNTTGGTR